MPELSTDAEVFILDLGSDENRFSRPWIAAVRAAIAEVEAAPGPKALVTCAQGKFWSNGLVVDEVLSPGNESRAYIAGVQAIYAAMLRLSAPSVAALNGHLFGAGAMFALAHDTRVMRVDRGWFCLPEVELGLAFTPGMGALVQARLSPQVAHEAMTTSKRYSGPEAQSLGIVDVVVDEAEVRSHALELARSLAPRAGAVLAAVRTQMYAGVLKILDLEAAG